MGGDWYFSAWRTCLPLGAEDFVLAPPRHLERRDELPILFARVLAGARVVALDRHAAPRDQGVVVTRVGVLRQFLLLPGLVVLVAEGALLAPGGRSWRGDAFSKLHERTSWRLTAGDWRPALRVHEMVARPPTCVPDGPVDLATRLVRARHDDGPGPLGFRQARVVRSDGEVPLTGVADFADLGQA